MLDLQPSNGFVIPDDVTFEAAPILPQDAVVKSRNADSMRLLGNSANGDMVEYLNYDDATRTFTHELVQDVEPVLEDAKRRHREGGATAGKNAAGDFYHAARVPLVLVHAWLQRKGLKMSDFKGAVLKEFLNDSDHSSFRIWKGRV